MRMCRAKLDIVTDKPRFLDKLGKGYVALQYGAVFGSQDRFDFAACETTPGQSGISGTNVQRIRTSREGHKIRAGIPARSPVFCRACGKRSEKVFSYLH